MITKKMEEALNGQINKEFLFSVSLSLDVGLL